LPTREQFFTKAAQCGLSNKQIYQLYRLLRKAAILYDSHRSGSAAERKKIDRDIAGLLKIVEKSSCDYLKDLAFRIHQDDVNITNQGRQKGYSPYSLSRAILDHHAEIYSDFLDWKESEKKQVAKIITRLEKRRKKALGSITWKYGLLAGVTAFGLGAGIYLHTKQQKNEPTDED
jgi:hypothetical protein